MDVGSFLGHVYYKPESPVSCLTQRVGDLEGEKCMNTMVKGEVDDMLSAGVDGKRGRENKRVS